jgi:acetylornithine deacetylase
LSPWSGAVENGFLHGRGSADMKGGLAAGVFSILVLQRLKIQLEGDVLLQSVVGEETGGSGTLSTIIHGYSADAAIVLEPTCLNIAHVQSGACTFRLTVKGRAAHAAMKNDGVSAIDKFVYILHALQQLEKERHQRFAHPCFDDPSMIAPLSIGTVRSGDWPSTVPDELVAEGRYGVFPGETIAAARTEFIRCLEKCCARDSWLRDYPPRLEWVEGQFEAGETSPEEQLVKILAQSSEDILSGSPRMVGVTYGSDLRLFTNYCHIPAVLFGPGDVRNAHAIDEQVRVDELLNTIAILAWMMIHWCGVTRVG